MRVFFFKSNAFLQAHMKMKGVQLLLDHAVFGCQVDQGRVLMVNLDCYLDGI